MKRIYPILTIVAILCINGALLACPMCTDSVPNSDAAQAGGLPTGFNTSVYLILGTFLSVLALVIGGIWHTVHTTPNNQPRNPSQKRGFPLE